jgi:dTDP-4-amino-4,6-dideoxygalactose transaminase
MLLWYIAAFPRTEKSVIFWNRGKFSPQLEFALLQVIQDVRRSELSVAAVPEPLALAGHEMIPVPMTFIATCWAISYVGAKPVFVDIKATTNTMDMEQVEKRITPRTRALLPVHLYGQPADWEPLLAIGRRHGIPVIEDAVQTHGAQYRGDRL